MNVGDLVEVKRGRYRWYYRLGIITKKLYTAYESKYDKWSVLMDGEVKTCTTDCIRRISNEQKNRESIHRT